MKFNQFSAWEDIEEVGPEISEGFDYLSTVPNILLKYHYERYNEIKLLKQSINNIKGNKLFEIGCATGELYRYFLNNYKKFNYSGFDISSSLIKRAHRKYPKNKFILLKPLEIFNIKSKFGKADLVWSRDVVVHQENPYKFIQFLIDLSSEATIMKVMTRDVGKTVFDIENSCQLHWGKYWVPFMVLNTTELINRISSDKEVNKIFVSRNYKVFGGFNHRYLPKDMYLKNAKTAETSILILKGKRKNDKVEILYCDRKEERDYSYFFRAVRKLYTIF